MANGDGQIRLPLRFENSVTTGQAALIIKRALGRTVSRQTIVRPIESGFIEGRKLYDRGQWIIDYASLVSYVQKRLENPQTKHKGSSDGVLRPQYR